MRDKNPSLLLKKLFFFVFFYLFSSCVPLSMMQVLIEREKGFMQKRRKREGGERERISQECFPLFLSNTHRRPQGGMPVSLLLSNLQEWKDRAGFSLSYQRRKEAYKYRREKNRREKFVLGEILTAPKRKISIKWSCRTTSIIHTHSDDQPHTHTHQKE
jgi:hypothetical protein